MELTIKAELEVNKKEIDIHSKFYTTKYKGFGSLCGHHISIVSHIITDKATNDTVSMHLVQRKHPNADSIPEIVFFGTYKECEEFIGSLPDKK
ncbi:MAG TPA: hypothetical protein VLC96_03290 [Flavobacterium sp.]|nr:hypothetical protein [Flavobacterium sp.]